MNGAEHKTFLDDMLNLLLRVGLFLAITLVFLGGLLFLMENGKEIVDYSVFDGEPASLKTLVNVFGANVPDRLLAIIQLGIILLIATPVFRVLACLIMFTVQRDILYVILSSLVLAILLFANL
ncbi:MAG TPA: DUF1634 domain-containing protein [Parachlamydiaceae bacterium]|nr:DUF1634 domain-containing protein [Parachlamydiaceae bacterium]